jgi:hypothetical protein
MPPRLFAFLIVVLALAAAPKPPSKVATATGENRDVSLTVTLYIDPADVERMVGDDLDKGFIVADVKVEPRNGKEVLIDRDDFTLRTVSNGARATPFAPSQIAGAGAIVIREVTDGVTKTSGSLGPFGLPGRKRADSKKAADAKKDKTAQTDAPAKASPEADKTLEQTLKAKELPQKKTSQPVSGLLYFGMEKQKMKDLSVTYGPKDDRILLTFK